MTIFSAGAAEAGTFEPAFCGLGLGAQAQGPAPTEACRPGGGGRTFAQEKERGGQRSRMELREILIIF